jgi:hypothetical protein
VYRRIIDTVEQSQISRRSAALDARHRRQKDIRRLGDQEVTQVLVYIFF